MNYDSQRIQQQGWQIEEPKEIGIIEAEYGESETRKSQYQRMSDEQKRRHNKRATDRRLRLGIKIDPNYAKAWKLANKEKQRNYVKRSIQKRKQKEPAFKIQCNLRNRVKGIIQSAKKGGWDGKSNFMGCNTRQLAKHLESMFNKHMTWDNYGVYWHVDHIIPCSKFDHTIEAQVSQCWHYTNLRPLEAKANMAKSDKITEPQMSLLLPCIH
jgi:hypothetical protein